MSKHHVIFIRAQLNKQEDLLNQVNALLRKLGAEVIGIDHISSTHKTITRDFNLRVKSKDHIKKITTKLEKMTDVKILYVADRISLAHLGGKIEVTCKRPITNREDLSRVYTPGVAQICTTIHKHPDEVNHLTIKKNTVAVVTDGSAVLGLGNIGPYAAMPVMEGKVMLLKEFADLNGFPICLATQDTQEIITCVKLIEPCFGAINLEDISAPRCFEIEKQLDEALNIPVFHDDQHGTAIAVVAALINALKIVHKTPQQLKVVISGTGAAGTACKNMIAQLGVTNIIGCDSQGALHPGREDLNPAKRSFAEGTNPHGEVGSLKHVLKGADVFIGVSAPNILSGSDIKKMAEDAIVFAMSNPDPEIDPSAALPHVSVMATGRSDYPNQINNLLAFPGIFKGALDAYATTITEAMKMAAAHAIAEIVTPDQLSADFIIPSVFNKDVVPAVSAAVKTTAEKEGVCHRPKPPTYTD